MVRLAKKLGANVWTKATPHHFSLDEETVLKMGANAKVNPRSAHAAIVTRSLRG